MTAVLGDGPGHRWLGGQRWPVRSQLMGKATAWRPSRAHRPDGAIRHGSCECQAVPDSKMGVLVGFVLGYMAGLKAGPEGSQELERLWQTIRESDELKELIGTATTFVQSLFGAQDGAPEPNATASPSPGPDAPAPRSGSTGR